MALPRDEEFRLIELAQSGDDRALDRLTRENKGFACMKARDYARRYGEHHYDDFVQIALVGLLRAIRTFDTGRGVKLISYAAYWMDAYLGNYCIQNHSIVKYGTTQLQRRLFFMLSEIRRVMTIGGREPTYEEIAAELRVSVEQIQDIDRRLNKRDTSLNVPSVADSEDAPDWISGLVSTDPSPEDEYLANEEQQAVIDDVRDALRRLPERDRRIVIGQILEERTLQQLGDEGGFSRERARQLRDRGLDRLREMLRRYRPKDS